MTMPRTPARTAYHNVIKIVLGRFTGLGGYPVYGIARDGEPLCPDCVRKNLRNILSAPEYREKDWTIVAADINWEDPALVCAHCDKRIPSAYAEPETEPVIGTCWRCQSPITEPTGKRAPFCFACMEQQT